jgi:hypothetical protein
MRREVVDTNVPMVANEEAPQAGPRCVAVCAERLYDLTRGDAILVLDAGWKIINEYRGNIPAGSLDRPGDEFLVWVLDNWANPARCELVALTAAEGRGGFAEFPDDPALASFHAKDRKFVAVACAHPGRPPILEAVDAGWWQAREALRRNGVTVEFLCEDDIRRLAE